MRLFSERRENRYAVQTERTLEGNKGSETAEY